VLGFASWIASRLVEASYSREELVEASVVRVAVK